MFCYLARAQCFGNMPTASIQSGLEYREASSVFLQILAVALLVQLESVGASPSQRMSVMELQRKPQKETKKTKQQNKAGVFRIGRNFIFVDNIEICTVLTIA